MSVNWTSQALGFAPNAVWLVCAWKVGNKDKSTFYWGFLQEALWLGLTVYAAIWTLAAWSVVGFVMNYRNLRKWSKDVK